MISLIAMVIIDTGINTSRKIVLAIGILQLAFPVSNLKLHCNVVKLDKNQDQLGHIRLQNIYPISKTGYRLDLQPQYCNGNFQSQIAFAKYKKICDKLHSH